MRAQDFNLQDLLRFMPEAGELRLGNQRNILISQDAFAKLRRLMHDQLGPAMARSLLTKFGYQNGLGDFDTLNNIFSFETDEDRLAIGPMMHSWSGVVRVVPEVMEMDHDTGHFLFKGKWIGSYEAEIHLKEFGPTNEPVCYTLAGYGSGWCSRYFGKTLVEVETKCVAKGDPHCEWEIRPWDAWGEEADPWKKALTSDADSIIKSLESRNRDFAKLNRSLESKVLERTERIDQLLNLVCHDLKNPLMIVEHQLRKLSAANQSPDINQYEEILAPLLAATRSMRQTIRSVDSGKDAERNLCLAKRPIRTGELASTINTLFTSQLQEKSIALKWNDQTAVGGSLHIDKDVFCNQILANLLTNAIKFSDHDSTIKINVKPKGNENIVVEVQDSGIGMPEPMVKRLLNGEGKICHRPGTNGETGTGIGINVVQTAIHAHGGRLEIDSVPASQAPEMSGTTYRIIIPNAPLA